MTDEIIDKDSQFIKRLKSFAWRLIFALIIFGLNWLVENITGLGLPLWATGMIALVVNELTKWLNNKHQAKKVDEAKPK